MGMNDIDKIARCAEEVREDLREVQMPYELALNVDATLAGVSKLVDHAKSAHVDEIIDLREIIEGLLANWPATEIHDYYVPSHRPVLTKRIALEKAKNSMQRYYTLDASCDACGRDLPCDVRGRP